MKKDNLSYLDVMKVLATILVVLGHILNKYTIESPLHPSQLNPLFTKISAFIYSFHMPAFVAISGAIYYFCKNDLMKYGNQWAFFTNKFKRLIIPYLFFAVFTLMPVLWYIGQIPPPPDGLILSSGIIS